MRDDAMTTSPADVDVVIPCYNYGRFLERAVACALDQPSISVRVIVVDDCSTDDTRDHARLLADRDGRIEYVRNEVNLGAVRTFNRGIDRVTARAFALVSADDLLAPAALTRAVRVLDEHPAVGLVHGELRTFQDGAEPDTSTGVEVASSVRVFAGREWLRRRCAAAENNIYSPEVVMRTEVQRAIGPYRTELAHTHDLFNWLCAAALSDVARVHGPAHAWYRRHAGSLSMQHTGGQLARDLQHRRAAFHAFFDRGLLDVDTTRTLRASFDQRLASRAIDAASRDLDRGVGAEAAELYAVALASGAGHRPAVWGLRLRRAAGRARPLVSLMLLPARAARRLRDRRAYRRWQRDPE